jgi:hypothetical protein
MTQTNREGMRPEDFDEEEGDVMRIQLASDLHLEILARHFAGERSSRTIQERMSWSLLATSPVALVRSTTSRLAPVI